MNRTRIRAAAAAAVLLGLLLLPSAPALGADCPLSVSPSSGTPGTRFTFSGHGYTPTQLRLTRDNHPARVVPLQLNGADPFTFSIVASDSDVGTWHAVAVEGGGNCRGTATLHVTLPSTATVGEITGVDPTVVSMAISGLGVLFVAVMVVMLRRSRRFGFDG
jgi:hypothetical protein